MHVPEHFAENHPNRLIRFLDSRGLASLVHCDNGRIDITHVPVFRADATAPDAIESLDGLLLLAHVARANPIWRRIAASPPVTVTWLGDQSYISADWYVDQPSVPTWNYSALHLHCRARIFDNPQRLLSVLDHTAAIFEPRVGGTWRRKPGNASYASRLLPGIIGIELTVLSHEAIFKLHQNHPPANVRGVIEGLRRQRNGECKAVADAMAEALREREPEINATGAREARAAG